MGMIIDEQALAEWADSRQCSIEIARAIFENADGDDNAHEIWMGCEQDLSDRIMARAWELAEPETDVLYWGVQPEHRPT